MRRTAPRCALGSLGPAGAPCPLMAFGVVEFLPDLVRIAGQWDGNKPMRDPMRRERAPGQAGALSTLGVNVKLARGTSALAASHGQRHANSKLMRILRRFEAGSAAGRKRAAALPSPCEGIAAAPSVPALGATPASRSPACRRASPRIPRPLCPPSSWAG